MHPYLGEMQGLPGTPVGGGGGGGPLAGPGMEAAGPTGTRGRGRPQSPPEGKTAMSPVEPGLR